MGGAQDPIDDHGNDSNNDEEIDYSNPPFPLTAQDREILALRDEDFHHITWEDLTHIIANNTLENLLRTPSSLRAYLAWSHKTKITYGSITNFVIRERLHWTPITSTPDNDDNDDNSSATTDSTTDASPKFHHHSPIPFHDTRDFAVLRNDWPYGFARGLTHLIVWSKVAIPTSTSSPSTTTSPSSSSSPEDNAEIPGDVTASSRRLISDFVDRYFVQRRPSPSKDGARREAEGERGGEAASREQVTWFKNWTSLQSVRGVDHVHVIVRDVPEAVLEKWTQRRDL